MSPKTISGKSVGNALFAALTQNEIAALLDQLLESLSPTQQQAVLSRLPNDTRRAIEKVLALESQAGPSTPSAQPETSLAKQREQWNRLWAQWNEIIANASDEEGEYFTQDEHWEPPYFDEYALIADLEQVAAQMRPLLQTAFENRFSPQQSFAEVVVNMEDEVTNGMPDWIELMEGFHLEKELTFCLLEWERLTANANGQDTFQLAEEIRQIEDELSDTTLDDETLFEFFANLTSEERRAIFDGMTAGINSELWQQPLQSAYSVWHSLYLDLIAEFAPEQRLVLMRQTIPQHWQNGLQVVEHYLAQNEVVEAMATINETVAALNSNLRHSSNWEPESSLLRTKLGDHYTDPNAFNDYQTLLRYYQQAAQALQKNNLANSLAIQMVVMEHLHDWKKILDTFATIVVPEATKQALFLSWRDYIVTHSHTSEYSYGYNISRSHKGGWVEWLLDSIADPTKGVNWFQTKVADWLDAMPEIKQPVGDDYAQLRMLTRDMVIALGLPKTAFPNFYNEVIRFDQLATADDSSRHAYLHLFAASDLYERLMHYWRTNLQKLMPNPGSVSDGKYSHHAQWLATLREIAPQAYTTLLAQWQRDFQRRRNLWTALEQLGLE